MADYSRAHVCQCLSRLSILRPNSTVTITGDRRKTGKQFVRCVLNLAVQLANLGLKTGDVVAICAFNSDWYLEWLLAVAYVGGILAPLNYRWSLEESTQALEVIRPVLIVTDDSFQWKLELQDGTMFCPRWHLSLGSFSSNLKNMKNGDMHILEPLSTKYRWAPEDVAIVCFTSGTTGGPKGVTISHTALLMQSLAKIAIVGYAENDVFLHTAPMCHIGGISSGLAMLMAGGCHVFIPKFEAKFAVEAIEENQVTSLITVPAILVDLISVVRLNDSRNSGQSLKKILNGGGTLSDELVEYAIKYFPRAKLLSAYGMTEACSSLTFITLYDPAIKKSVGNFHKISRQISSSTEPEEGICVGKPAPHVELMISSEDGSHIGRIMTRGPHVMIRYWGQNMTRIVKASEDWFDTGDVGHMDAFGNLWLVGRQNGRIKSGGENIYPEEVELVLSQHPGISAVVVVGVPQARLSEMVIACVQIRENWIWTDFDRSEESSSPRWVLSSEALKQFCRQKSLSGFKIPRAFVFWRKPFPRTSTGKLKRNQVKEEAMLRLKPSLSSL